ncbi:hypothetical protein [Wolbachia endosymbiont of Atemnus politus]|uniref:hypothetical protein n=1 Tax=Wolbachia endosymbiont of Atemnus politus TaxID=2682840 RepID=UPI00157199B8|nr:hypothetical protein [Wolbachia endosymbiont of Atemnus politus]
MPGIGSLDCAGLRGISPLLTAFLAIIGTIRAAGMLGHPCVNSSLLGASTNKVL